MSETLRKQKAISVLTNDVEAVRKLPDVYIGALGNAGWRNMVREIFQNATDTILKKYTLNKNIIVSYDDRNHTCIIEDNGPGIDLKDLVVAYSVLHSSSNYDKKEGSGEYSAGKNGMGGTITNYLSKFLVAESYREDGSAGRVRFEEGQLVSNGVEPIKHTKSNGMIVSFAPSEMMGKIDIPLEEIYQMIWNITHLCDIGTRVTFNSIDKFNKKKSVVIENTNGVYEILDSIAVLKDCVMKPIYFSEDNGTMKAEILFTYNAILTNGDNNGLEILNFANMCPTDGGTHVEGFDAGIVKFFRDHMNKIYLANNKKLVVNAQDIRTGLKAVISVYHVKPLFTGQSKDIFSKPDMKDFVQNVTIKALNNWASTNPNDLQRVCAYLKDICEIRTNIDSKKIKMSDKYRASVVTGLPKKYKKPNGKGPFEVIISEGDSACSGMENNRDKDCQGIVPIRGKVKNCLICSDKEFFENEEVAGLFKIFGYNEFGKKFDPTKFKPDKVIIATDADADGKHIECLLLGMFLKYLPFVITEGKLYCANPPLYGIRIGKDKMKFFADNLEYITYVQDIFHKENKICNSKGKELTKNELISILYKNMDYVKFITHISSIYAIDPKLLETILCNVDIFNDKKKFKRAIEKQYKFTTVSEQNGITMITGLVNSKYQTVFCDHVINNSKHIINMLKKTEINYEINGKPSTLYDLMTLFQSFEPKNLTRYKGLGEMPSKQLGISTIIPGMGRTLKQYTIDDIPAQLDYITNIQSDKIAFTKGIGNLRKEDII